MRTCVFNLPVSMTSSEKVFLFAFLVENTLRDITVPQKSIYSVSQKKKKLSKTSTLKISKKNTHFPVLFYFYPL